MKVSVAACLVTIIASSASAFAPMQQRRRFAVRSPLAMAEVEEAAAPKPPAMPVAEKLSSSSSSSSASTGGALVPIKEETVEFTAGLIGGVAGFAIGGPVLGAIGAAAANYLSKMDGDATDVVQAVSKSSIQVFNYLAALDSKYEILTKAKESLKKTLDKLKKQDTVDPETVKKVESAIASTNAKLKEVNDEYDLVGGGLTALGVIGDLVEKAVKKAGEINEEYQLTEKALAALQRAVDKAKSAAAKV